MKRPSYIICLALLLLTLAGGAYGLSAISNGEAMSSVRTKLNALITRYNLFDAKGDLVVGTGADTAAKVAIGTDGQILFADSNEAAGVLWDDSGFQPLEATLTDIADGTIVENLVNTANPWADNEVADNITVTGDVGSATVTASGFSGNLTTGDDTLQEIADALDALSVSGTSLTVAALPADGVFAVNNHYYEDALGTTDSWTLPASPSAGDIIRVDVINAAATTITFVTTSPYRTGEGSTASLVLNPSTHQLVFVYSNSKWRMADSGIDTETANYFYAGPTSGGDAVPTFRAMVAADIPNDLIDSQHLAAGGIDNEHLADDAVDSDEIAAGAIDAAHLSTPLITESETFTIFEPDSVQAVSDIVPLKHFPAEKYPNGVTMVSAHVGASASNSDAYAFEESASPTGSTPSAMETVTLTAATAGEDDGTFTDGDIAADSYVFVDLDDAADDIAFVVITLTWTID